MITGQTLSWTELVVWTFSVCLVGIIVATGLRKQLIEVDQLTFPGGVATGETLREMYSHGREALARVWMLGGAAIVAALVKITEHVVPLGKLALPGSVPLKPGSRATLANLGFAFEPTTLMYGVGALIGPRVGISMMIGALVAWG